MNFGIQKFEAMLRVKRFLKKILGHKIENANEIRIQEWLKKGVIRSGENSLLAGMKVDIRDGELVNMISIGDKSIVEAHLVLENHGGRISIGSETYIGNSSIISIDGISIGNRTLISWGCTIMDNDAHSLDWSERRGDVLDWHKGLVENQIGRYKNWDKVASLPIVIGDDCWIGFNAIIIKGVKIGDRSVVAAGSVVTNDIPSDTLVGGNPARIIRSLVQ